MTNKKLVSIIVSKIILEEITLDELEKQVKEGVKSEKALMYSKSTKKVSSSNEECIKNAVQS